MLKAFNTVLPINLLTYFPRNVTKKEYVARLINTFNQPNAHTATIQLCVFHLIVLKYGIILITV